MDCLDAKQKLEPCARGELGPTDRAELDRHVATCEGCRLELELTRAVLGSSSAGSPGEPSLDPDMEEDDPVATSSFDPSIEPERATEIPPGGPEPPRVLTSQLPEDSEDELDLESLHAANAYDPGAIDLPHPEPQTSFEASAPASPAASTPDENFSFDDLAAEEPVAASVKSSAAPAGSGAGGSWNFEPVDVPRTATPPEESLSFAKEALDRKRGKALREKQGARLMLWIGGAIGGVGLLGVSVWMALAFREPGMLPDPGNVPAVQPPPGVAPDATAPADSVAPAPEGTPGLTATDSASDPSVAPSVIKAGVGALPGITAGVTTPKAASGSTKQAPRVGAQPAPAKAPETASKPAIPAATPAPVEFRDDELAPAPRREPQILTVEPDGAPGSDRAFETADPAPAPSKEPTKSVSTAPIFVPPSSGTKPSTGTAKQPSEDPAAASPIGRLHVATITAEKNKDLEALRKLKEPWKSLIRTNTGADRSRSKREYADCLWAIQELTGRHADRKEALAAYREFVLHAPAGGTDARTVSRMRHLEDILSDSQ